MPASRARMQSFSNGTRKRLTMKPGTSAVVDGALAEALEERVGALHGRVGGQPPAHDLDEAHQRRRVAVVRADHPLGMAGPGGDGGHRERRRVGVEERLGAAYRVELAERRRLEPEVLEHGLDDDVAAREVAERVVPVRPASAASRASASSRPFSTLRSRKRRTSSRPRATRSSWRSRSTTRWPARAIVTAIPAPIVPAPSTPTCSASVAAAEPARAEVSVVAWDID